ncbi:MAG: VWA domain-containing protein [Anaerolineae bacterium]|nr:VWA domain-containing protein [Anaerolineae bacterium]
MATIDSQKDYYAILQVSLNADDDEIKQAYREKARDYHPDSGHGDAERFREVQEAYEVLRDEVLRRAYDRQREKRGLSEDAPVGLVLSQSRTEALPLDEPQVLYVLVDIQPNAELQRDVTRRYLNVALVVDCSTSMSGARMQNVKIAAADLVEALGPQDRLAIVAFSDRAEVFAPAQPVDNPHTFRSALAALTPSGGTEIYQGLAAGLEEVRRYASSQMVNHVILLTDGRTYGDETHALTTARQAAADSISISAFGIGEDWNDEFLDALARNAGGVSRYIRAPSDVRAAIKRQIQGLSSTLLQNVKLEVNMAPYVHIQGVYRAAPYLEILENSENHIVALGNVMADEPVSVVLEFVIDQAVTGERRIARLDLVGEKIDAPEPVRLRQDVNVTFTLEPKEEPVPTKLLDRLARLSVFHLQERAWKALGSGDVHQATTCLEYAATRLFDMGHRDLGQAAMLEVSRLVHGGDPTKEGRKKLRYGTRSLTSPM